MASDDIDPRFDPHFQRGHEDDPVESSPAGRPVVELAPSVVELVETRRQGRNPWMVVLWVLAIVLLAIGLASEWISNSLLLAANFNSVQEFYIIPKTLESVAPWFVAVGLASVVGVVFLHAVRWDRDA